MGSSYGPIDAPSRTSHRIAPLRIPSSDSTTAWATGVRVSVTSLYQHRCAVTGERTLPILDAAHIRPYEEGGEHDVTNGLLFRTDIHRLFDKGYVTISNDSR